MSCIFAAANEAARRARHAARDYAVRRGADPQAAGRIALCVGEVASTGVMHAYRTRARWARSSSKPVGQKWSCASTRVLGGGRRLTPHLKALKGWMRRGAMANGCHAEAPVAGARAREPV